MKGRQTRRRRQLRNKTVHEKNTHTRTHTNTPGLLLLSVSSKTNFYSQHHLFYFVDLFSLSLSQVDYHLNKGGGENERIRQIQPPPRVIKL